MKKHFIAVLSIALLLTGCSSSNSQSLKPLSTITNENTSQPAFIMSGKIDASGKADIMTKISARVLDIKVDIGSSVKQGQTLVVLDTKDLSAQVSQAQAAVYTAQASLSKVQNGVRPEQIEQAQAQLDSAQKNYEIQNDNYTRSNQLFQDGVISKQQLETAEVQLKSAQAQYAAAKSQLELLNKGETKETINVYQAQVNQAQAALKTAQTQLANGTIISPISGKVSIKNINTGEMASPGAVLLSIVDSDSLYVNAYLPSRFVGEVKAGQKVIVRVPEVSDKLFAGEISVIDPVIDSRNKNVLVKVRLKDKVPALKTGMFAEVALSK